MMITMPRVKIIDDEKLVEMWKDEYRVVDIAEYFGVERNSVYKALRKLGYFKPTKIVKSASKNDLIVEKLTLLMERIESGKIIGTNRPKAFRDKYLNELFE